jgi:hypothetical protein
LKLSPDKKCKLRANSPARKQTGAQLFDFSVVAQTESERTRYGIPSAKIAFAKMADAMRRQPWERRAQHVLEAW